jgi:hypothetical protein
MNEEEIQNLAEKHNLSFVEFESKIPKNGTKPMIVGYVFVEGHRELFCKKTYYEQNFHLCNEFRNLI